jgi:hypothetical protein
MKAQRKGEYAMKKSVQLGGLITMVLAGCLSPATAALVTLSGASQMEDTYLRGDNSQTSAVYNYGAPEYMIVGQLSSNVIVNSLMRFTDLSGLSGKTVTSATLRLYNQNQASQTADVTLDVYEVAAANGDWVEGTSLGVVQTGSSDWRFKIQNTGAWAGGQNGCGVVGTDYTTHLVGSAIATDTTAEWVEITLDASVVQKWIDNPSQNYGIILTAPGATANGQIAYLRSSEATVTGTAPQLVLNVIPEPATVGMLGLGAGVALLFRHRK